MNNLKKIGLTALAASLVSTSVFSGEVTVSGGASMTVEGYSGTAQNAGKGFSMGNQLTFSGSGELDNGLTASISFVLDQGDNETDSTAGAGTAPFDNHSVSISSDALGTLTMHGEGGSSAQSALDTTAAGDIWDTFDNAAFTTGETVKTSAADGDIMVYTLPSMVDDLSVSVSYSPQQAGAASSTAYGLTYTGVEGLSVSYGQGDASTGVATTEADATTMKASYAYGSFTVAYSNNDYQTAVANKDQETTSYKVSYTVSDELSISYGQEEIELESDSDDAEFEAITVAYTSGGMTLTASAKESTNAAHNGASTIDDRDYWSLGLAFAF
ncbi:porin [Candidatus Pelagibacter ubique]|nr:porin [Candidatus Pelagibacter ubique]